MSKAIEGGRRKMTRRRTMLSLGRLRLGSPQNERSPNPLPLASIVPGGDVAFVAPPAAEGDDYEAGESLVDAVKELNVAENLLDGAHTAEYVAMRTEGHSGDPQCRRVQAALAAWVRGSCKRCGANFCVVPVVVHMKPDVEATVWKDKVYCGCCGEHAQAPRPTWDAAGGNLRNTRIKRSPRHTHLTLTPLANMANPIIPSSSSDGEEAATKLGRFNAAVERSWVGQQFKLAVWGMTFTTELRAGMATFLTMAYILAVNASILPVPSEELRADNHRDRRAMSVSVSVSLWRSLAERRRNRRMRHDLSLPRYVHERLAGLAVDALRCGQRDDGDIAAGED
ncbi:hypothetical protein ABZP36_035473 [Zizania latifolia]